MPEWKWEEGQSLFAMGMPTSKCGPQKAEGIQEQEVRKPWASSVEITWDLGEVTWAAIPGTVSSLTCCRA